MRQSSPDMDLERQNNKDQQRPTLIENRQSHCDNSKAELTNEDKVVNEEIETIPQPQPPDPIRHPVITPATPSRVTNHRSVNYGKYGTLFSAWIPHPAPTSHQRKYQIN